MGIIVIYCVLHFFFTFFNYYLFLVVFCLRHDVCEQDWPSDGNRMDGCDLAVIGKWIN